jgi:cellulose synthase (UDP-forming)
LVCIEQPRFRSTERLPTRDSAIVRGDQQHAFHHRILDISLGGARLAGSFDGEPGTIVMISFNGVHLPATIVRCGESDFAVRFDDSGTAHADLIRLIYSGRYSTTITSVEPMRVAAAVLERVMR